MTDFEKQAYANMTSSDRCLLFMARMEELIDLSQLMTNEDIALFHEAFRKLIAKEDSN